MLRLIRGYYLGTPVFFLADVLFSFNVRVAFLDQWPTGKFLYYILASFWAASRGANTFVDRTAEC